jgi:hypothetical protein
MKTPKIEEIKGQTSQKTGSKSDGQLIITNALLSELPKDNINLTHYFDT